MKAIKQRDNMVNRKHKARWQDFHQHSKYKCAQFIFQKTISNLLKQTNLLIIAYFKITQILQKGHKKVENKGKCQQKKAELAIAHKREFKAKALKETAFKQADNILINQ